MNEEELQLKMPAAIQPPRAHLFDIAWNKEQTDDCTPAPLFRTADIPILAANLYYASPITLLASGMYGCFQNIWLCLLLVEPLRNDVCWRETQFQRDAGSGVPRTCHVWTTMEQCVCHSHVCITVVQKDCYNLCRHVFLYFYFGCKCWTFCSLVPRPIGHSSHGHRSVPTWVLSGTFKCNSLIDFRTISASCLLECHTWS